MHVSARNVLVKFLGPDEIMILCSISLIAVKLMLHLYLDISGVLQNVLNAARLHQSHNCTSAQEIRLRLIFFFFLFVRK